jgi:hypothetical protein
MTDDDVAKVLSRLPREYPPPPGTEVETVAALRAANRLGGRRAGWRPVLAVLLTTAAAVVVGVWIGARNGARTDGGQSKFLVMLYEDLPSYQPPPPGERPARVAEYSAWANALARAGHLTVGEALVTDAVELRPGRPAEKLPATALQDAPDGFFIVLAGDEAAAVAIAETCPHLHYGGRVVVRPINPD